MIECSSDLSTLFSCFLITVFIVCVCVCVYDCRPLSSIDTTVQTAITVCCAYLVFFTAQFSAEVSGVLACCAAGLMLSWLAPPLILDPHTLHTIWGFIEWVGNTLIFLLAGLIIGGTQEESTINISDVGYTIILYGGVLT